AWSLLELTCCCSCNDQGDSRIPRWRVAGRAVENRSMPVEIERERDGTAVLRLNHGPVNALDGELLGDIVAALDEIEASDATNIVISGAGSSFSAGVDLKRIVDGGASYVRRFMPALSLAFVRLFSTPLPLVAAVNGHAIAGGCVVACAAERRLMADGGG